jgi:hypothetical protein
MRAHLQAEHMDASDLIVTNLQKILQAGGRPHMGVTESPTRGAVLRPQSFGEF